MKASDLDKVKTLLEDLSMARITLRDFDAIPENAEPFLIQTSWYAPDHRDKTKYFSLRMNPKFDGEHLIADLKTDFRNLLDTRVERLEFALTQLGVDPAA